MATKTGPLKYMNGQYGVTLSGPSGLSGDVDIKLPVGVPGSGSRPLMLNSAGEIFFTASAAANAFFAGPASGGSGAPAYRGIVWADVSDLAGSSGASFCAGNDARLHTQNTDTGTTATSFQIDSANSGPRVKNVGGVWQIRNAADSAFANFECANMTVHGDLTVKDGNQVELGDQIILLNKGETGTPTADAGIEIRRGTSANARVIWNESTDRWQVGIVGDMEDVATEGDLDGKASAVRGTFVAGDLSSGVLTITHNLGVRPVKVSIFDAAYREVIPDDAGSTTVNAATADLSSFALAAETWHYLVVG